MYKWLVYKSKTRGWSFKYPSDGKREIVEDENEGVILRSNSAELSVRFWNLGQLFEKDYLVMELPPVNIKYKNKYRWIGSPQETIGLEYIVYINKGAVVFWLQGYFEKYEVEVLEKMVKSFQE